MLNDCVYTLDDSLEIFQSHLIQHKYLIKNLSYINYSKNISNLIDQAPKPSIVLAADNIVYKGVASLGSVFYIHSCFNVVFIDHLALQILPKDEVEFIIGHEIGHAITGDSEYLADLAGIKATSFDTALSFLNKLPLYSQALTQKYSIASDVPKSTLVPRICYIEGHKLAADFLSQ